MACLRSRALQTSFRPFTRPIKERGVQHVFSVSGDAINPRADRAQILMDIRAGAYRRLLGTF